MTELDQDTKVYVAGHRGLAGSALWRLLEQRGHRAVIGRTSSELDLRDRDAVDDFFQDEKPEAVVLAAARVGGIAANAAHPIEHLSDNMRIELNVMDAARAAGVDRLLFIASSAAYPRDAQNPISESALMTGPPEPAHAGYALAKLAGVQYVASMRERGAQWFAMLPTNIYGPDDNFHAEWSHVVPALLRKFHEATLAGQDEVVIWGSGTVRRELLHSDDLASGCLLLLSAPDAPAAVNVGPGTDVSIMELAETIADIVGFKGTIDRDTSRPDGAPQRLLDSSRLRQLGWEPKVDLRSGLTTTYEWLEERWPDVRM